MTRLLTAALSILIMIMLDLPGPLEVVWLGCAWACGACTALALEEEKG